MKRIFVLALIALIGVVVTGRITLGEAGAMRFLMTLEGHMDEGRPAEGCDMLHDELEFHVIDRTADTTKDMTGGKEEYCALVKLQAAAMTLLPTSKSTKVSQVKVSRDWMHPWTSHVTYTEDKDISIRGANVTIRTTSDDEITLVQTFTGVKLRKHDAEVWRAE